MLAHRGNAESLQRAAWWNGDVWSGRVRGKRPCFAGPDSPFDNSKYPDVKQGQSRNEEWRFGKIRSGKDKQCNVSVDGQQVKPGDAFQFGSLFIRPAPARHEVARDSDYAQIVGKEVRDNERKHSDSQKEDQWESRRQVVLLISE